MNPDHFALAFAGDLEHDPTPPLSGPLMTREEAHSCLWAIRTGAAQLRALVYDLYHRQGFRALGYATFRDCIRAELSDMSESHLYRQAAAGLIEQQVLPHTPIGTVPESVLRPLGPVPPLMRKLVFDAARDRAGAPLPTSEEVEDVIDELLGPEAKIPTPPAPPADLAARVKEHSATAATLADAQDGQRTDRRLSARLLRSLKHLAIALKGLRVCGKTKAAILCEDCLNAAAPNWRDLVEKGK